MQLKDIKNPEFLKDLSIDELEDLASEIRSTILNTVANKGGHLSSNLGSVEASIALHKVFDAPKDLILFDVGHQSYTHKILTGRYNEFVSSLREKDGLSGYQKKSESIYDSFEAGHSSTSISAAMGMKKASMIKGIDRNVIAFIGDSSIASGMAFEALNNLSTFDGKIIIVLNDNGMAISKPNGGFFKGLSKIRGSESYNKTKMKFKKVMYKLPLGKPVYQGLKHVKNVIKRTLLGNNIFDNLNIDYLGPVDGHNIKALIKAFNTAKINDKSIVVHITTKKGYGYAPSENDEQGIWHGVPPFNLSDGTFKNKLSDEFISWSEATSDIVYDLMKKDKEIVTITPAMVEGSKLGKIQTDFKDRFYDVNIAEEHATTFASGLALEGVKPYLVIYSTFMQRAYDQISHDVSRMHNHVVFGVDRSGLVGKDGETHQGIYDVSMLKSIPNTVISMPKDMFDAKILYNTAFNYDSNFFIRYPREDVKKEDVYNITNQYKIGEWDMDLSSNAKLNVIVTGPNYNLLLNYKREHNLAINLFFARFYNPLDKEKLALCLKSNLKTIVYDAYSTKQGLYTSILEECDKLNVKPILIDKTVKNEFIKHASIKEQLESMKLDFASIIEVINNEIR